MSKLKIRVTDKTELNQSSELIKLKTIVSQIR